MKRSKLFLAAMAGVLTLASCSKDDDNTNNGPQGAYDNGILILNEGGFQAGNASVSYLSGDLALQNNIFTAVNGRPLGDTGQDIGLHGDLAYIVVNNSSTIEVVNRYTFESVTTISNGLDNPRYIAFSGNKAYITNWGDPTDTTDDYVAVLDLTSNTVTSDIPVGEGPEDIIENNGKLYVSQKGGYGYGNTVTVIDTATNTVSATIPVDDVPGSLAIEGDRLYVLCEGMPSWAGTETAGSLDIISMSNNTVVTDYPFASGQHPANLVADGISLYFTIDSDIYSMNTGNSALPSAPIFSTTDQGVYGVYSMAVKNGSIYIADAGDYNSNGKVYIYSLTGELQNTFTVGVIPSGFYFND